VALRPFERLDVRLLIDAEDDGVLWWVQVEADDLGRLRGELGVIADAPAASPLELDAVLLQDQPDLVGGDITECLGHEPPVPAREAFPRWFVQYGQDPALRLFTVGPRPARPLQVLEAGQSLPGEAHPPGISRRQPDSFSLRNARRPFARGCGQDDPGSEGEALLGRL